MKKKEHFNLILGICSLSALAFYNVIRYKLFDLHGLKEFPGLLVLICIMFLIVSFVTERICLSFFATAAYPLGFVVGLSLANFFPDIRYLWLVVFSFIVALGVLADYLLKKRKQKVG